MTARPPGARTAEDCDDVESRLRQALLEREDAEIVDIIMSGLEHVAEMALDMAADEEFGEGNRDRAWRIKSDLAKLEKALASGRELPSIHQRTYNVLRNTWIGRRLKGSIDTWPKEKLRQRVRDTREGYPQRRGKRGSLVHHLLAAHTRELLESCDIDTPISNDGPWELAFRWVLQRGLGHNVTNVKGVLKQEIG